MSLILDALRKSDRQRTRQAAERLRDGPGPVRQRGLPGWLLGGLLASVLMLAIALFIVLRQEYAVTAEARAAAGTNPEIMENEPPLVAVRPLGGELAATPGRAVSPADAEIATPSAASVKPDTVSIDDLNATPFDALPVDVRAQLPRLHVDIHAWSEDPQARFVLINLRRYQEGDRLQEGPLVRRILPDGVVLDSNGTLFSLPRQ